MIKISISLIFFLLSFLVMPIIVPAKNLGIFGKTYPIAEEDFLSFIEIRVNQIQHSGQWQQLQNNMQRQAIIYRDRPKPVTAISHTKKNKSWLFDPSITFDHDVVTVDGALLVRRGDRINPLAHIALTKTLIFYDADDPDEVNWVIALDKKLQGKDKLILVRGSVFSQEQRFHKLIFFDQNGVLTQHFQIEHVPALIEQQGLQLQISEVKA